MGSAQIVLTKEDGWWVAEDATTGVVSQGRTRQDALANLDEALAGAKGEGHEPGEQALRDLGIDPAQNESSADGAGLFE